MTDQVTNRERGARIRERLERDYVVNMDDGEWLLERVERYREALEQIPFLERVIKQMHLNGKHDEAAVLEEIHGWIDGEPPYAHRALNDGEDDG